MHRQSQQLVSEQHPLLSQQLENRFHHHLHLDQNRVDQFLLPLVKEEEGQYAPKRRVDLTTRAGLVGRLQAQGGKGQELEDLKVRQDQMGAQFHLSSLNQVVMESLLLGNREVGVPEGRTRGRKEKRKAGEEGDKKSSNRWIHLPTPLKMLLCQKERL